MDSNAKHTILVVDDDKFLLTMYQTKFGKAGWAVEASLNAAEALQKLRDGLSPDAVMFDIIMPGVDGVAFLETIKKEKLAPRAALVALTNQGQEDGSIEKVKALGVDGYIVKAALIPSEVVEMVQRVVDGRKK
ncbi:MAG: response regulator [bacterium]|nr:response regulator [bacterium]